MSASPRFLMLAACALFVTTTARAQVANGGFETGDLTGWTSTGTASAQGTHNSQAPYQGNFQAVISAPRGGTVSQGSLESFLNLTAGSLNQFSQSFQAGGSAIKQAITVVQGAMLQFAWNFLPNGAAGLSQGQNDVGFFVLHLLSTTGNASSATKLDEASNHPTNTASGYSLFTTGPLAAGTYLLGFVDFDNTDSRVDFQDSDLLVDGVSVVNPVVQGVPDQGSTLLLLAVAIGALVLTRRRLLFV